MTVQFFTSPNVCFCTISGKQTKQNMHWSEWKNVDKFHLSRSVAPNSQLITRFDCHAATCLPDDVQECLRIQEATGEVWISQEHNIINTAVNKGKNHLCACVYTMGQNFD